MNEFKDHVVQNPDKFIVTDNPDGTKTIKPFWIENPTDILQAGTPFNAETLNAIPTAINEVTAQLADIAVNVKTFGAVGDGVTDDTQAFRDAVSSGATSILIPKGTYKVQLVEGQSLMSFINKKRIRLKGESAVILDVTNYTADTVTPIVLLDNCADVDIQGIEYNGVALANPAADLGYKGATYVYAINGTQNLRVDAFLKHARYGVRSGEYGDETKGSCKVFKLKLKTEFVGYPLATYLANDVEADIYAEDVHRAIYIAGMENGRFNVKFKNQYIADVVCLITDAKTGVGTSKGCKNIKVNVSDLGSTVFTTSSACAGITLSRVDPDTVFSDIEVHFNVVATDVIATRVGGFKVASAAKSINTQYPYNWEPYIYLSNIKVSGVIDRSKQTVAGNTAGDIYVMTEDTSAHVATLSNIDFSNVTIIASSGETRDNFFYARGLKDVATFSNFMAENTTLDIVTNANSEVSFINSKVKKLIGNNSKFSFTNSTVNEITDNSLANSSVLNSRFAGAGALLKTKQIELTLTGASVNWTGAIPAGSLVLGLTGRVTQEVTGATGYTIGAASEPARYVNTNTLSLGSTFRPLNQSATEVSPRFYLSSTDLIVTAKTSNFTAGKIKLLLFYFDFIAPTQ